MSVPSYLPKQFAQISLGDSRSFNIKLAFTVFFSNLIILIDQYKIRFLNLDQTLLFLRSQVICLKNWKLWRAVTTSKFIFFLSKLCKFPTLQCVQKDVPDILYFAKSWAINKNVKKHGFCKCVETRSFLIFEKSKQNEKNPGHPFVDAGK